MIQKQKCKKNCRWLLAGVVLFLVLCPVALAAWFWPEKFLLVEQQPEKADAIVLLGGGGDYRPPRVLELYREGLAPVIIISGKGDAEGMRLWLEDKGVPRLATRLENKSTNTWQNAKFSVTLLREMKAQRVILVTSWFHSRRALACFHKAAPEIKFISLPTVEDRPGTHPLTKRERWRFLYEYIKLAGYTVRYGINPF
jgi:uncharacterized SAM-binding protein YcdF (DUF218 family)